MPSPYTLNSVRKNAVDRGRGSKYGSVVYALIYIGDCIRSLSEKEHNE